MARQHNHADKKQPAMARNVDAEMMNWWQNVKCLEWTGGNCLCKWTAVHRLLTSCNGTFYWDVDFTCRKPVFRNVYAKMHLPACKHILTFIRNIQHWYYTSTKAEQMARCTRGFIMQTSFCCTPFKTSLLFQTAIQQHDRWTSWMIIQERNWTLRLTSQCNLTKMNGKPISNCGFEALTIKTQTVSNQNAGLVSRKRHLNPSIIGQWPTSDRNYIPQVVDV